MKIIVKKDNEIILNKSMDIKQINKDVAIEIVYSCTAKCVLADESQSKLINNVYHIKTNFGLFKVFFEKD